jgi:hypothetical protein
MKLVIIHDATGKMIAMGETDPDAPRGVRAIPQDGQFLLELEKSGEFSSKQVRDIVAEYTVDVATRTLVPRRS